MRSSYCVWAPGREGVSARGRGVVLSSFSVVLSVSDRVCDACHLLVGKILHQRLVQLRASAGLAGGGIALLASDLRIGLPVDLSPPWAAKTGMPPPILPKSWKRSMPSSLPSDGIRVSRPNRVAASLLSALPLALLPLLGAVVCGRMIGSSSMPKPRPPSGAKVAQKSVASGPSLDATCDCLSGEPRVLIFLFVGEGPKLGLLRKGEIVLLTEERPRLPLLLLALPVMSARAPELVAARVSDGRCEERFSGEPRAVRSSSGPSMKTSKR
jgi:hypothetical protein